MEEQSGNAGQKKVIFLTGATGHVGRNLIPRLLQLDAEADLIVLIRGKSDREAEIRLEELLSSLDFSIDPEKARRRIRVVRGDITSERFGLSQAEFEDLASRITHVIHCAASTKFNLPLEEARRVNVEGTKNVMALARLAQARGNLVCVAHISTAFVSGKRSGLIKEGELDSRHQFSNTYEQTKFEAETYLREHCRDLPLIVFRPSIIVGDSRTGATTVFNVIYIPLKYMARGLLKYAPCSPATPLDIVPVDFVCAAICYIVFLATNAVGKTYHLCAGPEKSTTVGEVALRALDYFNKSRHRNQPLRLQFISKKWMITASMIEPFLSGSLKKVLRKWKALSPQMEVARFFDLFNTENALRHSGITAPLFKDYCPRLLHYCDLSNWGERTIGFSVGQGKMCGQTLIQHG